MKRYAVIALLAFLLAACSSKDPEVTGEIQATLNQADSEIPDFDDLQQKIESLLAIMQQATPPGMQSDSALVELREQVRHMTEKNTALKAQYSDLRQNVADLERNYQSGKVKKNEARDELDLLRDGLNGARQAAVNYQEVVQGFETRFSKALAEWRARQEE